MLKKKSGQRTVEIVAVNSCLSSAGNSGTLYIGVVVTPKFIVISRTIFYHSIGIAWRIGELNRI